MKKTYLLQRGKFEERTEIKKGIDSIISLDYMGSSEFEWGAIPKSLGRILETIDEYTYLDVPIKDKVITVFCKDSQRSEMKNVLEELSENKISLKRRSDFKTYINPSQMDQKDQERFGGHKTDFWWDIENDFMFFKKNIEFETRFKKIKELEKAIIIVGESLNMKETTKLLLFNVGVLSTIKELTYKMFTENKQQYFEKDDSVFNSISLIRKYCQEMSKNGEVNFDMP